MNDKNRYYKKFDYIRVFACIAVLLYHTGLLKGGYLAVCTFFVLSGYLSASSLMRKPFRAGTYYLNRLKRIWIPLALTVFVTAAAVSLIPSFNWMNFKPETTSVLLGYNNYWQIHAGLDYFTRNIASPFMHFWYIAILIQFDLAFPLVFLPLKKLGEKTGKTVPAGILGSGALASFIWFCVQAGGETPMAAYYGTFSRLFSLLGGVLLGYLRAYDPPVAVKNKQTRRAVFPLLLGVLSVMFLLIGAEGLPMMAGMLVTTFISMRLIDYGMAAGSRKRPSDQLLTALSSMTYEVYLVQYPVIFLIGLTPLKPWLAVPLILILTFVTAYLLKKVDTMRPLSLKNVPQIALTAVTAALTVCGMFSYVTAKDHTDEMAELEARLEENQKLIEEKNKEQEEAKETASPEPTPAETETAEETEQPEESAAPEETEAAETEAPVQGTDDKVTAMLQSMQVVGIGDSILLDAVDQLYEKFPNGYFDAAISRDLMKGKAILEDLKSQGKLPDTLILCLATNGDYADWRCEELMKVVGDRDVFWVNAVGADDPAFNDGFAAFAASYPNIHIIDWAGASADHPEYFYPDGIHVVPEAVKEFTNVVYSAVYDTYKSRVQ